MSEWLRVPGFSRYEVSDVGDVRGKRGRPVKAQLVNGYMAIDVWSDDDKRIKKGVHGTYPSGAERCGERHPMAKLTDAQVAEIRARYTGAIGQAAAMAAEYGVSKNHFIEVARGRFWRRSQPSRSLSQAPTIAIAACDDGSANER